MTAIDSLKKRATALAGAPAPGDARATARLVSDLCEHVGTLNDAVSELIRQMADAQAEIARLKKQARPTD